MLAISINDLDRNDTIDEQTLAGLRGGLVNSGPLVWGTWKVVSTKLVSLQSQQTQNGTVITYKHRQHGVRYGTQRRTVLTRDSGYVIQA